MDAERRQRPRLADTLVRGRQDHTGVSVESAENKNVDQFEDEKDDLGTLRRNVRNMQNNSI